MKKAMAPHSSTLAWKIPWMEEPGGLQSDFIFTFHFSLSCTGEGNGNPLQCSCLENPWDGKAWWAAVYGVAQSRTRLKRLSSSSSSNNYTEHLFIFLLAIYMSSFVIYIVKSSPHFLFVFGISFISSLNILYINHLFVPSFADILSHYIGCLFVHYFLCCVKVFKFD